MREGGPITAEAKAQSKRHCACITYILCHVCAGMPKLGVRLLGRIIHVSEAGFPPRLLIRPREGAPILAEAKAQSECCTARFASALFHLAAAGQSCIRLPTRVSDAKLGPLTLKPSLHSMH